MADGAHHYHEAERLLERAATWGDFDRWPMDEAERVGRAQADAAQAQVHATLALAWAQSASVRTRAARVGMWKP